MKIAEWGGGLWCSVGHTYRDLEGTIAGGRDGGRTCRGSDRMVVRNRDGRTTRMTRTRTRARTRRGTRGTREQEK